MTKVRLRGTPQGLGPVYAEVKPEMVNVYSRVDNTNPEISFTMEEARHLYEILAHMFYQQTQ